MRKVAVLGNAGGGKSTLARRLHEITAIPLYPLDRLQFRPGGGKVDHADFLKAHDEVLEQDTWIIDGYGDLPSSWQRFTRADTLVYIDLPLGTHRWWVTRRLVRGLFRTPEGWPERSPIWRSTLDSYRVIGLYERHLAPKFRRYVAEAAAGKRVHHLTSPAAISDFLTKVKEEFVATGPRG